MVPQSNTLTPPSTPRPIEEILALTQQITPRKSQRTVRKIHQDLQLQANDLAQECDSLKRHAVNAEQQVDATRRPRKKHKRGDRACNAGEGEVNAETTKTHIRDAGCGFAVLKALFLIENGISITEEDEDFDIDHEFDSTNNELQGELHNILALLSNNVRPKINESWVQDLFLDGLHGQRTSIRHCLRTESLHVIADDVKHFKNSATRFQVFSTLIGYIPATGDSEAYYNRFEVPILYDQWDGKIDLDHLFWGDVLLKVFASIICGPKGAEGLFESKSKLPQAKCLECIHKITSVTPGSIVIATILTIWLFSADTQLIRVRDETSIDYASRHRVYIHRIREGLRDKKVWAVGLLNYWNHILFPNADKSQDHGAAGSEHLEDDEEIEDLFAQASQVDTSKHDSPHAIPPLIYKPSSAISSPVIRVLATPVPSWAPSHRQL
ncbi:hypothetical protein B0H14DRAFT_3491120 [Mycena olivaceomarginata]|nr:hypothetical protein B0H14DRAFT_3491120 [Mycena olivaceomarginata]